MRITVFKLVALGMSLMLPIAASASCESEYQATLLLPQSSAQKKQNETYREMYTRADLLEIQWDAKSLAVRAHYEDDLHSPGRHRFRTDDFPLSACIMRILAEDRSKFYAPFAQEAYALKLLAGDGVPKDRKEAMKYLTRASESWHNGSATIRLGRVYLEGKPSKEDIERAVYFLNRALKLNATTEGGSANPGDATEILFDIYLSGKYGNQNIIAAKELLRERRSKPRPDDGLYRATMKYPALAALEKETIEEERQAAINRQNTRPDSRREVCTTYSNGYKSCRSSTF